VVISSMGLEVASVISVAGVWGTSWVAGVCSDDSMLHLVFHPHHCAVCLTSSAICILFELCVAR
jgi:hypothetical protein